MLRSNWLSAVLEKVLGRSWPGSAVECWQVRFSISSCFDQNTIRGKRNHVLAGYIYYLLNDRDALSALLGPCNRLGFASAPLTEPVASRPVNSEEKVSVLYIYGRTSALIASLVFYSHFCPDSGIPEVAAQITERTWFMCSLWMSSWE